MTESSFVDLNSKLADKITIDQFRPNFVVSGPEPFVEDRWKWVKIGDSSNCTILKVVKPCTRLFISIFDKFG